MALRVILETCIAGRYVLHAGEDEAIRWSIDHDSSRRRYASQQERDDVVADIDADHKELETAMGKRPRGLPTLEQMIKHLPASDWKIAEQARAMLYGPLSDWHMHAGGGAIGRYSDVREGKLTFVPRPRPIIAPEDMLSLAFGLTGGLAEEAFAAARPS